MESLEDLEDIYGCHIYGIYGYINRAISVGSSLIDQKHPETVALYIDGLTVQDNRTAAERATTEAVAEGVAAKRLGPMESTEINCTERISVDTDSAICQIGSAVHYYISFEGAILTAPNTLLDVQELRNLVNILCSCAIHVLFMCYSCAIHVLFMCYSRAIHVLFMCYSCAIHVLFMCYSTLQRVLKETRIITYISPEP